MPFLSQIHASLGKKRNRLFFKMPNFLKKMQKLPLVIPWQNSMKYLCLGLLAVLLVSCSQSCLKIQTDYLSHKTLASYYVGTPDPRQNDPAIGQRLIIGWSVPKSYLTYDNLRLEVSIRFRN